MTGFLLTKVNFGPFSVRTSLYVHSNLNYDMIIGTDIMWDLHVFGSEKDSLIHGISVSRSLLKCSKQLTSNPTKVKYRIELN